ncbi:MAG: peptidylprolyl isomerase [Pseudobdellovibrionaceae bacterium]
MARKSEDQDENKQANNAKVGLVAVIALALILAAGVGIFMTKQVDTEATDEATSEMAAADASSEDAAKSTSGETDVADESGTDETGEVVIARVNGEPITRADAEGFIANIPQLQGAPFEEAMPIARDEMITGTIIDQLAKKSGTANDPEVEKRLQMAREGIIRSVFLEEMVKKEMTDAKLQEAYAAFKKEQEATSKEQVKAKHILVATEEEAMSALTRLKEGESFDDLAKEISADKASGANGGELGWFSEGDMVPEFSQAAFALNVGEVSSEPVKSQFGYHIIKVEDKRKEPVPSIEEVKPYLEVQQRRAILEGHIADWRNEADVKLYNMDGSEVAPATGEMSTPDAASEVEAAPAETETEKMVDPASEEGDEALESDTPSE